MTPRGDAGRNVAEARVGRLRCAPLTALQLFGLTGLALAQPLFSLLGENPTFFVAHGAGQLEVIAFALLVIFVPAVVLTGLVLLVQAVAPRAATVVMAGVVGLLATVALFSVIDAVNDANAALFSVGLAAGTVLLGLAYRRLAAARTFVTFLGPAPLVFVGLFLFVSPASDLALEDDPAALAAVRAPSTPVVVVLFDELPLGALLDGRGQIDARRFPNFGRLAATSTWYPNTTSVSAWTHLAVPAILTGTLPDQTKPPVAGQYPRSLFTLLGDAYDLEVSEQVTSLCPESLCEASSRTGALARDTGVVALHQLLPDELADRWLPSISGRWTDFAGDEDEPDLAEWQAENAGRELESDFGRFLAALDAESPRTLWYHHEMVVHMPYRFLPDGTSYQGGISGSLGGEWTDWFEDPLGTVNATQRFMLQLRYADRLLGELLDTLEERELFDDALVAVVADHGVSFEPGGQRRGVTHLDASGERVPTPVEQMSGASADEVMPVPLFIRYPDQVDGRVDERQVETTDLLPTIADALEIQLPADWRFDGRSLLADPEKSIRNWIGGMQAPETFDYRPDPGRMAAELRNLFGPGGGKHDLYALGPAAALVGQEVDGRIGPESPGAVRTADPSVFDDVDPEAPVQPALYVAQVVDVEPGSWIAVALNGTVAGLGPVYTGRDGVVMVEAMLDPSVMIRGENEVQVFRVGEDNATLHPIVG